MISIKEYQQVQSVQEIHIAQPELKTIYDTVTLYGKITEEGRANLYAAGNSVVEEVFVKAGDMVKKGDALMTLRTISSIDEDTDVTAYSDAERWINTLAETGVTNTNILKEQVQAAFNRAVMQSNSGVSKDEVYELYSPISGMVISVSANQNDVISSIFPCVAVTDLNALSIHAEAPESALPKISEKDPCSISVTAFGDASFSGTITSIQPFARQADFISGGGTSTTEVIIALYNRQATLRPGYSATVKISVNQQNNAVLVPYEAIAQDASGREYVMIWNGAAAYRQYVTTGSELDSQVQIISGVFSNDTIICNPDSVDFSKQVTVYEDR